MTGRTTGWTIVRKCNTSPSLLFRLCKYNVSVLRCNDESENAPDGPAELAEQVVHVVDAALALEALVRGREQVLVLGLGPQLSCHRRMKAKMTYCMG